MTTTTEAVCIVCGMSFKCEGLPEGWRIKHEIPDGVYVCPWCANRGWPKFRVMFQALSGIAAGGAVGLAEEALWCVVGVPPEVSSPTEDERRKVVRKVKRRRR